MTSMIMKKERGKRIYLLENNCLQVKVVPSIGGKTISIFHKEKQFELLYDRGGTQLQKSKRGESFESGEASGFDDAFPSIEKENINFQNHNLFYEDHGEIWTSSMSLDKDSLPDTLKLNVQGIHLPYSYEKRISLSEDIVSYYYKITNNGEFDFPCIWAMHCLVRYEEDMKLLYPDHVLEFENVLASKELGEVGTLYQNRSNNPSELNVRNINYSYTFDKVPSKDSKTMLKYYVKSDSKEGFCGYEYPTSGVRCSIRYEKDMLPYLGVWVNAGGYRGEYNCALEPANGYYDSISKALERKKCKILTVGESISFSLHITLSTI